MPAPLDIASALAKLKAAADAKKITALAHAPPGADPAKAAQAYENIQKWLLDPTYATYRESILEHIAADKWQELDNAFWTIIPFGTGGRRGRMYPFGCNAINERTIGESAQGLADYINSIAQPGQALSCAIAYDTRRRSTEFAELCAGIMAAAGFTVYFLRPHRSTPELSFLVRQRQCTCGIMVTASHNPPTDNAVKVYWSTGGQITPPHDARIIERVMSVKEIRALSFAEAEKQGKVIDVTQETDRAFQQALVAQAFPGPRDLKLIYSPLHGVGATCVLPVLSADGFRDVTQYEPHAEPSPDFPNVPGHVSNPENPRVFDAIIASAKQSRADLIIATDPDCDRIGTAAPVTKDPAGDWRTFTGNQIGVLLGDYVLERRKQRGDLSPNHFVVTTLVTTPMLRRVAESYGVRVRDNLQVGFKNIALGVDEWGPDLFVYGTEESHGYVVGQYARDKDGAVAAMLMAELAAQTKAAGKSLHEKLDSLYWQHGYHGEAVFDKKMEGSDGMRKMSLLMAKFRGDPPPTLGGLKVTGLRDYKALEATDLATGRKSQLDAQSGDLVILDLAEPGNAVAVRPSGTEPKIKFYMFTCVAAEQLHRLEDSQEEMGQRLAAWEQDLRRLADSI